MLTNVCSHSGEEAHLDLHVVTGRLRCAVRSREAQWRPSRLHAEPLDEAVEWLKARKRTWNARMDRLEAHLRPKGDQDE